MSPLLAPRRPALNAIGAVPVAFTLVVNLGRGYPLLSHAGTAVIAGGLFWLWVRAGWSSGVEETERIAESDESAAELRVR